MESSPYQTKQRLMAVICLSAFVFFILFARLFALQIIDGAWLRAKAADQWTRDLPIIPKRGDILDTNGNVLASSETAYTVYVRAKSVTDARFVSEKLSALLGLDYDAVYAKVSDRGVSEATLKRQVDGATADEIRSFNFNGVYLASEPTRVYTYGDFLSQVLGYVSSDNVGQTGIEAYYDKYLKGIKGQILTQSDLVGAEIEMLNIEHREQVIKNLLAPIRNDYDYILIDCSPSLGLITVNALTAANSVIIPVQCEYFALEGISKLLNTIKIIKSKLNPKLEIEGFLLTMYDSRLKLANQIYDEVKRHFQELVFKTVIQRNVKLSESPSHGLPVILYDADSTGSKNHLALAKEIINKN